LNTGKFLTRTLSTKKGLLKKEQADEAMAKRIQAEKNQQDEYKKKLEKEHIELLKLRAGVLNEEETSIKPDETIVEKPTGVKAIENFWYHYKVAVILIAVFASIGLYLLFGTINTDSADISIMVLTDNGFSERVDKLETLLENYATDVNNDGKIVVDVVHIPIENLTDNPSTAVIMQTKFIGEMQIGTTMLVISNDATDILLLPKDTIQSIKSDFPDNPSVTDLGFKFEGEKLEKALDWEDMPKGMYLGIRKSINSVDNNDKQYIISKKLLDKLIIDLSE